MQNDVLKNLNSDLILCTNRRNEAGSFGEVATSANQECISCAVVYLFGCFRMLNKKDFPILQEAL
jgi:hypothetical protein